MLLSSSQAEFAILGVRLVLNDNFSLKFKHDLLHM